jgi:hypothetical protein
MTQFFKLVWWALLDVLDPVVDGVKQLVVRLKQARAYRRKFYEENPGTDESVVKHIPNHEDRNPDDRKIMRKALNER